jgi:hypothetical protein
MREVARRAGLSVLPVSWVFNEERTPCCLFG